MKGSCRSPGRRTRGKFGATKPGDLLTWPIALRAIFDGMTKGMFTGKKLADYEQGAGFDYVGARRIVNGTDKAQLIAGYAVAFEAALVKAKYGMVSDPEVATRTVDPTPVPASAPKTTAVTGAAVGGVAVAGGLLSWLGSWLGWW